MVPYSIKHKKRIFSISILNQFKQLLYFIFTLLRDHAAFFKNLSFVIKRTAFKILKTSVYRMLWDLRIYCRVFKMKTVQLLFLKYGKENVYMLVNINPEATFPNPSLLQKGGKICRYWKTCPTFPETLQLEKEQREVSKCLLSQDRARRWAELKMVSLNLMWFGQYSSHDI